MEDKDAYLDCVTYLFLNFGIWQGSLTDGTVFDSSHERGDPIEFELGAGQVIQGWYLLRHQSSLR